MTAYWLERAWLSAGDVVDGVRVEVDGTRIAGVEVGVAPGSAQPLRGITVPGFANCHSHAFHRALRGRTQRERGSFWTWREQMYGLAATLTPDSYFTLARAAYAEMVAAGITSVGEFHYLHHARDGAPYADPNAMGHALIEAAREAGLRIALLDTCYLAAGIGRDVEGVQRRFSDGDADSWAQRWSALAAAYAGAEDVVIGAAIHSVRAVPRDQLGAVVAAAAGRPLHVHLSEQVAENEECLAAYGLTPTGLLAEAGALGPDTSLVHATHLSGADIAAIGAAGCHVCLCPTTERDLADGIGPAGALHGAGARLTLGSDSHAVVDPFEEMRAMELHERLATGRRGHWRAAELLAAGGRSSSLGFADAVIAPGARADLVTVDSVSPRTAGTGASAETVVFAATAAEVRHVVSGGTVVFTTERAGQVGARLEAAIAAVWEED
ncbi:formimidoylglutamate deiminase [Nocardioides limicola]|uniref:formimidoylglutamate deiminase n=1 Tax=Nocardioides limicola TaxID=2803368 RepID=UPI00193B032F|nr:formimidoylglutamate deiminase [Nocardioides sp. DJM-14]